MSHPAWNISKFFYCLNLERNTKRWASCVEEFIKVGIDYVERINCIESDNRYISFNHSHYDTIKRGYGTCEPFTIFEDDIHFELRWKTLEEATVQIPADWDILFLGANITGTDWKMPDKITTNICRLHNAWMTHAIVYSHAGAKWVLDNFNPDEFPVYDEWLRVNAMPQKNVYLINPMICQQIPGYSDIWQREVHYGSHKEGNNWLKENI